MIEITEPTTMLTDFVLGILAYTLGISLLSLARKNRKGTHRYWAYAFFSTAVAAFVGGFYHGFHVALGQIWAAVLWQATLYAAGFVSLFFLLSGAAIVPSFSLQRWVQIIAFLKFILYSLMITFTEEFRIVIYDYVGSMVMLILIYGYAFFARRQRSVSWIFAGILISLIASGVQASGYALHKYLNHNDLYHLILMAALLCYFLGVRRLKDE